MRFAVLSVNPGIDRTLYMPEPVRPDAVNRASRSITTQGSKGANAAVMLRRLGCDVTYYSFGGGVYGDVCGSILAAEDLDCVYVPSACGIRVNTKVISPDGRCTELNERGGPFSAAETGALCAAFLSSGADVCVLTGSLPAGTDPGFYAALIPRLRASGAAVVLDCDGPALAAGIAESPDVIKPNGRELRGLMEVCGLAPSGLPEDDAAAVRERFGVGTVLLTLGGTGSVLCADGICDFRPAARVPARGFAAAGDCFLAGYLCATYAMGLPASDAHLFASSCGAAKVSLEASLLPRAVDVIGLYNSRKASC
jgi:1-phosphofructokinase